MTDIEQHAAVRNEKANSISHADGSVDGNDLKAEKTIDTIHQDEAMKVLGTYHGEASWTPQEEKQVQRIIDWRLMPCLCATYCLQYYDKAMLGQAVSKHLQPLILLLTDSQALFGIQQDLGLTTGNRYSMTSSIFYLGYIMGAYPAMVLAQRYPVERVTSIIVTVWGVCLLLTICCTNYQGIYAQRFFLGLLESGVSPLFMLIVGSWYKKNEQAFRMGIWYSCTGYVSIISPLINYGWGSLGGPLSSWKYMYIFAGALTISWGVALWFILPPDPIRTKIFNERQQYIAVARLRDNNTGVRNKHYKVDQIKELMVDTKVRSSQQFILLPSDYHTDKRATVLAMLLHRLPHDDHQRPHLHIQTHHHQLSWIHRASVASPDDARRRICWYRAACPSLPSYALHQHPRLAHHHRTSHHNAFRPPTMELAPRRRSRWPPIRNLHPTSHGRWIRGTHGSSARQYRRIHETLHCVVWSLHRLLFWKFCGTADFLLS